MTDPLVHACLPPAGRGRPRRSRWPAWLLASLVAVSSSCHSGLGAASPPAIGAATGDELLARRIVLHDASGRKRIVLDAETGIELIGADGRVAITLQETKDQILVQCGHGTFVDTPDGPIWEPRKQLSLGVAGGTGFLHVSGPEGYTHVTEQGARTERVR
jgi:hypothetical protein